MSAFRPDAEQRIEKLAAAARELTDLPVAEQYQRLAAENGLTLSDTGWEVVYDPDGKDLQKYVTVIPVVKPHGEGS